MATQAAQSILPALQARRVFATMDKTAQLILISPDNVMGARIRNAGTLSLTALYASTSGRVVSQVQLLEGVAILRLDDRRAERPRSFEQVRERAADLWQRDEADRVEILSGVYEGLSTGTPIARQPCANSSKPGSSSNSGCAPVPPSSCGPIVM